MYTVRVILPKCALTTVRSCFSADELKRLLAVVRGHVGRKKEVQVFDLYDNNGQQSTNSMINHVNYKY